MQDCHKDDPHHVGQVYCVTEHLAAKPTLIGRECFGLQDVPEWHLPKPPVGGVVCVDIDTEDDPPQKVFDD